MTFPTPEEIAREVAPCPGTVATMPCPASDGIHWIECPSYKQPAIADAIRKEREAWRKVVVDAHRVLRSRQPRGHKDTYQTRGDAALRILDKAFMPDLLTEPCVDTTRDAGEGEVGDEG